MAKWFERAEPMSFLELRQRLLAERDILVAAVRVSVGIATTFADVFRLLCFLQGFVDRTVDDIDRAGFRSAGLRLVREPA